MNHKDTFNPEAYMSFLDPKNWSNENLTELSKSHINTIASMGKATLEALQETTKAHTQYAQESLNETSALYKELTTPKTNIGGLYEAHNHASRSTFNKALSHNEKMAEIFQNLHTKILNQIQAHQNEALKHVSKFTKS